MISRLKAGLFLMTGVVLVLGVNFGFDRVDEALGCDLGDHAWGCAVQYGWKAVHNWWAADNYRQFLVDGPNRDAFVNNAKKSCIESYKGAGTDEQIAAFCRCWAGNLADLATPTDLRYIARHEEPPLRLQQQLDERASACGRQPNGVK
jgi:hypothetical protein